MIKRNLLDTVFMIVRAFLKTPRSHELIFMNK